MKSVSISLLVCLLMVLGAAAQDPAGSPAPSGSTQGNPPAANPSNASAASGQKRIVFNPGTLIPAELSKSIDAKKAKQGDPVTAKIPTDLGSGGTVVIPRGSKVIGHVTDAQPRNGDSGSRLGIAFDKIVLKDGEEVPFHAVIQALAPAPSVLPTEGDTGGSGAPGQPAGAAAPGGGRAPSGGMQGNTSAGTSGSVQGSDNSAAQAGAAPGGALTANSRGTVGMKDVTLAPTANAAQGSVLTSDRHNVKLDSGTQMVLRVESQ
jgi:hypothetical protein